MSKHPNHGGSKHEPNSGKTGGTSGGQKTPSKK